MRKGCELEERIRLQVLEKRRRAQQENETADPSVYDALFNCEYQNIKVM
ncbi:hypothetical protein CHISP_3463 [Chitinispirillum alkaliphilum]|nr:hypothetical protein CHISP_3463 [Chitinispirillum alkaliphilum]